MRTSLLAVIASVVVAALAVVWLPGRAAAYPEPDIIPKTWQFQFTYNPPKAIACKGSDGVTRWYWYVTYTVTNKTDADRLFVPQFLIATDEGDRITAGRGVPSEVFDQIKTNVADPLLEDPASIVGRLLQGPDNARHGVIIWPAFDKDVFQVNLFVGGLSGETKVVKSPDTNQDVLVSKNLMIRFEFPGNPQQPRDQVVKEVEQTWVMR